MRLSGLASRLGIKFVLAAILLFSSTVFAQHHEASAPSSPPPSAAPSPAPSPAPAPASVSTSAPSAPASVSVSHGGEASAPASARAPENQIDYGGSAGGRSTSTQPSSGTAAPVAHTPASGAERAIPENKVPETKIASDDKLTPGARIGETSTEKVRVAKPGEPDLRRRICTGGDCKEPTLKANPPQSDLRHRICPGGVCHCPAGQTASKGGCVTNPTGSQYADQNQYQYQCAAGQWWNGASCSSPAIGCAGITSRAEMLLNELQGLAVQVRDACTNDPGSAECDDAKMRREGALQRYRMLQNEATPDCLAQLLDPPL